MTNQFLNDGVKSATDWEAQHQGSESLAINNTYCRRLQTRVACHTTAKFFKREGSCVPISRDKILKTGYDVHLTEATTLDYVATHTTIPVPRIHCSFLYMRQAYIVMERIHGEHLSSAWKNLSKESRQNLLSQLQGMIKELRALKPPLAIAVGSCVGGSLYDPRLPHGKPRFGPFDTIQGFHRWLRDSAQAVQIQAGANMTLDEVDELKAMIEKQDGPWDSPVFTHCDLNPTNILVRGDRIVGIIDWEIAGWYPSYWEYTCAWLGNQTRTEWQKHLNSILDAYPDELAMEKTRFKWWGEW